MTKARLLSTVAATLLLTAGIASAQGMKDKSEGAAPAAQQTAPAEKIAPASKSIENKKPGAAVKAQGEPTKMAPNADKSKSAQSPAKDKSKAAQSPTKDKSKSAQTPSSPKGVKASDSKPDAKPNMARGPAKPSATTGQGAAAGSAKLSPEQHSKITTIIRKQKVERVTLNITVRVGARVPQNVHFYRLPQEVYVIYPRWRGYDYIMVGDQIIVLNPRTHEIVAILDA